MIGHWLINDDDINYKNDERLSHHNSIIINSYQRSKTDDKVNGRNKTEIKKKKIDPEKETNRRKSIEKEKKKEKIQKE